jgi:rubrerythrin
MSSPFHNPDSPTIQNLEAAFAGESMAHIKYRYFARLCRELGDEETAKAFEATADQEVMHAFSHLDLLFPKSQMSPARALQFAIDGETYEYTEMYPKFHDAAVAEGQVATEPFKAVLEKAGKRFAALAKVELRHAAHYQTVLDTIKA